MTQRLLSELIALPSVNPAFLPPKHPNAGEKNVADFLAATAARAGLDVAFESVLPGRANFLATLSPRNRARRRILLAPHLDTVNGTEEQFHPKVKNGRLYGRGACDTKGSVAAMLSAMMNIALSGKRPAETEIVLAALVDEEINHLGAQALVKSGWKADLAIIGEPTRLQIVTAHKGALWLELRTKGKAAHGSCPERGHNAVHEMARIVDALETDYQETLRRSKPHPLLGHGTVNVGSIRGGTQPNIVPDSCSISIDRRTLPGETTNSVRKEIQGILRKRGLQAQIVETQSSYCGPMETSFALPQVRKFAALLGQKEAIGVTFFCDGAVLTEGNIPSVIFGPGDIAQAHTTDEWIDLRSVGKAERLLRRFFEDLA